LNKNGGVELLFEGVAARWRQGPRARQLPWLTMKKFLDAAIAHMDTGSM
jgi:hypothetical protein